MKETLTAEQLANILLSKGLITKEDLFSVKEDILIPISIFSGEQSPLGALVNYLSTIQKKTIKEISEILKKNISSLYRTYQRSNNYELEIKEGEKIPLTEFQKNTNLSVSETLVLFLREKGYKNVQIGKIFGKDPRTIWTLETRARKKVKL